ncbi:VacJ family lipoprotein [Paraburkholderia sp.]|uniref:MlaA family lipoprotein n=1 Tax=Paraburkholderia sp. TaxID=1926495 RepID=UPI0023A1A967|nr:VacJ family lipoprotein [Paraburkholderia sp.]MDE1180671.1 VacJ family lipoprotein [Paraburkholderia sp.]
MQTMRVGGVRIATMALAATLLVGCSTVQTPTKEDPLEGLNRTVFKFNDTVDQYALKPVAKGYVWITPQPVRDSVTNFFSNIGDVYIAANNLLQLKITDGVEDIMRIVINTVFGVGGLFDVATLAKLPKHENDLGLTLGHYGVPAGPYLVLPLFGPSTVRDAVGSIGNYYVNPLTYIDPPGLSWALYGLNVVNVRANLLNAGDVLEGAALDKYSFIRNAYLQRRRYLLSEGKPNALPDYGDTPPPNYDDAESASGAATAAAPAAASGASAPQAASAASASDAATTPPLDLNGGPETTTVPANSLVPPGRLNFPALKIR